MGVYEQLDARYQDIEGRIAALSHEDDPDARGSQEILRAVTDAYEDIELVPISGRRSKRIQNNALEDFLGESVKTIEDPDELEEYDWVSLVDCNPSMLPGSYEELFEPGESLAGRLVSIHDHHPIDDISEKLAEGGEAIINIDEGYGSTVSLLVDKLLQGRDFELSSEQSTAAYYGIQSDTDGFLSVDTTPKDHQAAEYLLKSFEVDQEKLGEITKMGYRREDLDIISKAWTNGETRGNYFVGGVPKPLKKKEIDSISKASEEIVKLDEVDVAFVYGVHDDIMKISVKSAGTESAENLVKEAYEDYGGAGGHRRAAGAQVGQGIFERVNEDEGFQKYVALVVEEPAWEAVGRPSEEEEE
ncbi:MAG: DHH family phosphoesterase [Candidatus Aenigmatarchaeota archaeon]